MPAARNGVMRQGASSVIEDDIIVNRRFRDTRDPKALKAMFQKAAGTHDFGKKGKGKGNGHGKSKEVIEKTVWRHRAYLITDIAAYKFSVKESDEEGALESIHDVDSLTLMYPDFAAAAKQFAESLDQEPARFVACAVYALVEIEMRAKRHNVYRRLAYEAQYETCTQLPDYLTEAIRRTWSSPGEKFIGHLEPHQRGK
jgi:hypothetical protein